MGRGAWNAEASTALAMRPPYPVGVSVAGAGPRSEIVTFVGGIGFREEIRRLYTAWQSRASLSGGSEWMRRGENDA